jgi:hypothetical protein
MRCLFVLNDVVAENFDIKPEENGTIIDLRNIPKVCRHFIFHSIKFYLIFVKSYFYI